MNMLAYVDDITHQWNEVEPMDVLAYVNDITIQSLGFYVEKDGINPIPKKSKPS